MAASPAASFFRSYQRMQPKCLCGSRAAAHARSRRRIVDWLCLFWSTSWQHNACRCVFSDRRQRRSDWLCLFWSTSWQNNACRCALSDRRQRRASCSKDGKKVIHSESHAGAPCVLFLGREKRSNIFVVYNTLVSYFGDWKSDTVAFHRCHGWNDVQTGMLVDFYINTWVSTMM